MSDSTEVVPAKRHLFQKGVSGNPAGRKPGTRNKITIVKLQMESELRARQKSRLPAIVDKILDMAEAGDKDMLKLVYDSWIPKSRSSEDDAPRTERIQVNVGRLDSGLQTVVSSSLSPAPITIDQI